ncbi:MAG: hypothetical protein H6Q33_1691 [Deltaproteobacteria bacterium]|nr:hypothetical protein [Deltaproteobacteria bacterium]
MPPATISLQPDSGLDEAAQCGNGLTDRGTGPFVEPLPRVLNSLAQEGRLNGISRMVARERMVGHTTSRLPIVNDRMRLSA